VEGIDVVDLQVHLDEGFPVDVVVVDAHRIEHVAAEVPVRGGGDLGQVLARIARAGEQQSLPLGERVERSFTQGLSAKCGAPSSSPFRS